MNTPLTKERLNELRDTLRGLPTMLTMADTATLLTLIDQALARSEGGELPAELWDAMIHGSYVMDKEFVREDREAGSHPVGSPMRISLGARADETQRHAVLLREFADKLFGRDKERPAPAPSSPPVCEKEIPKGAVSVVKPQGTEETGNDRPAAPSSWMPYKRCNGRGWIDPPWPVGPGGASLSGYECDGCLACKPDGAPEQPKVETVVEGLLWVEHLIKGEDTDGRYRKHLHNAIALLKASSVTSELAEEGEREKVVAALERMKGCDQDNAIDWIDRAIALLEAAAQRGKV